MIREKEDEMVRAYIFIEAATGKAKEVESSVPQGLSNCKALAHSIVSGEVVVHLHCNNLDDLNTAIIDIAKKDGVEQITTCHVKTV